VRREFPIVERTVPILGGKEVRLVYLDHAASTHAAHSVVAAYVDFLEHDYSNIHRGTHLLSRRATVRFDEAHGHVAKFLGAERENGAICFVTNTTQAIDLASHVVEHLPGKVVTTEMEHHSNELPHRRRGDVLSARIGMDGMVDLGHLAEVFPRGDPNLPFHPYQSVREAHRRAVDVVTRWNDAPFPSSRPCLASARQRDSPSRLLGSYS
jgi:selenocysteine lyase/cysteine desulfurase